MKKFVTVLLAVCLLTAALAGCASSAKTDDKTSSEAATPRVNEQ